MDRTDNLTAINTGSNYKERDLTMEAFDATDRFLENKLFPFVSVAVPVYLTAHIVVMLLRQWL